MTEWIAERELLYSEKGNSSKKKLIIRVGKPYYDSNNIPSCPIEYDGLFNDYSDIKGADLLHALHLAADIDSFLKKLSNSKYDFYFPDGEPYFE